MNDPVITPDIITIKWEPNGNSIQFYTNNPYDIKNVTGATYWDPKSYKAAGLTEDVIEVNASKMSGLSGYGYGSILSIFKDEIAGSISRTPIFIRKASISLFSDVITSKS